jgi:serine/threonine-protein kinase HipA
VTDGPIEVYADWTEGQPPEHLGTLTVRPGRASELFAFTFAADALTEPWLAKQPLDPDIGPFPGPQFPKAGRSLFGMFKDASPDRWGETLIRRRFELDKRAGTVPSGARLGASDYLLGVHDAFRSGALRLNLAADGPFLDNRDEAAAPPFVCLRELEAASNALEADSHSDDAATDARLRLLLAAGASLGGARPKASVVDPNGHLWIAKFPSVRDRYDSGVPVYGRRPHVPRPALRSPR